MIIKPRVRGFICVTAHPQGCAANVAQQVAYVKAHGRIEGPKRVLVIGASTGYGLAARITSAFGCEAATLGVFLERPGSATRPASAGWYNDAAFEQLARESGRYSRSLNGDAFADEAKRRVIDLIRTDLGQIDLLVYSLAAPRRTHPKTGEVFTSVIKPIGGPVRLRGIDTDRQVVKESVLEPATQTEIDHTVAVMGGEDWQLWIEALQNAGVLATGFLTTAFTYLGDTLTHPVYWDGSIGAAKKDLDRTVLRIRERLAPLRGDARIAVLKAVVTQASSAIPIMPLYISILFKVMMAAGTHEGCIEQVHRLYRDSLCSSGRVTDAEGRLRADDLELDPAIQAAVRDRWDRVSNENLNELTDFASYQREFLRLFGFEMPGVDYDAVVNPEVAIPDLVQL